MALKTILTSDLTGEPIEEANAATMRITFQDPARPSLDLDVGAEEIEDLLAQARAVQAHRDTAPPTAARPERALRAL
jgi:hypothetical protein